MEHNGGACCSLHNKGEEGGYRYYHGSLQSASEELDKEEIPADVHVTGLGGQNASKSAVVICSQDTWVFLNIQLVHFDPSLSACIFEAHLGGRVK